MGKTKLQTLTNSIKSMTVEPYIFLCYFGYMVRLVSYQSLLKDRACHITFNYSDEICRHLKFYEDENDKCIAEGNNLYTTVSVMSSVPAIVVAVFLGPWSDKYSRKYPLIIAMFGLFLESAVGAVLTAFKGLAPIYYTLPALFAGVTGGLLISASGAFSYLSDITDERSRASRFAILDFFGIFAIICATTIGGQLYQAFGYFTVMCLAPLGFATGLLYTSLFVKETKPPVPPDKRGEMFRDLLRIDNIKLSYVTCSRKRPGNIRMQIWMLVWIGASQKFVDMGTLAAGFPYANKVLDWEVTEFSNASTVFYIVNAFVTLVIVPFLSTKVQMHEAAIGFVGVLSIISKMTLTSVSGSGTYFYFAWLSGTLANATGIAVRSRLSKLVYKEELGRAFSLLAMCEAITPLIGSVVFLQLYNASLDFFPGLPFAIAAVLTIPSAIIFAWMMRMPSVSLAEFARNEEMKTARPLKAISSNYARLKEEEAERY